MTRRQQQLLDYVSAFIAAHGRSPTYRQIADALGYRSISNITRLVRALASAGLLRYQPNRRRIIEPVSLSNDRFLEAADQFCRALSNGHAVGGGTRDSLLIAWRAWRAPEAA